MYIRTYACLCVCVCVRESVCSQPVSNDTGNYTVTWSHKVQTFDSKLSFYTCNRCQDFQSCMLCLWPMSGFRETERAAVTHEKLCQLLRGSSGTFSLSRFRASEFRFCRSSAPERPRLPSATEAQDVLSWKAPLCGTLFALGFRKGFGVLGGALGHGVLGRKITRNIGKH